MITGVGRRHLRTISLLSLVAAGMAGVLAACALVLDGSDALPLPAPIVTLLDDDHVAYAGHAGAGAVLDRLDGPASLAGVQWIKAAAHARSDGDVERAAAGITLAIERGGNDDGVRTALCAARSFSNRRQIAAATQAGLICDGRSLAFLLDATATPSVAPPGGSVSIGVTITSTRPVDGIVHVDIRDSSHAKVFRRSFGTQHLGDGPPVTHSVTWPVPHEAGGAYTVSFGVFRPDWSGPLGWNDEAAVIEVR